MAVLHDDIDVCENCVRVRGLRVYVWGGGGWLWREYSIQRLVTCPVQFLSECIKVLCVYSGVLLLENGHSVVMNGMNGWNLTTPALSFIL